MKQELLSMSKKELNRLHVVRQIVEKHLTQKKGALELKISERQMRRLVKSFRREGDPGLISKKRGKVSNNRISDEAVNYIIGIVGKKYEGFGPTLAAEKLKEVEKLTVSVEWLRQRMIDHGLWKAKSVKKKAVHQTRERRKKFGELIQIDGSPHDWFEGRRDECTLLVFIDDATGEFMHLRFEETETTEGYAKATRDYIKEYGVPFSFYSDKHGIFRVNHPESVDGENITQFGRMAESLGIEIIYASTPQAKGRVERANQTLQDRLVKELRINNINTIEEANEFLKDYKYKLTDKFAVKPDSNINAHRKLTKTEDDLDVIFSIHTKRVVSKNLEIRYENNIYRIAVNGANPAMKNSKVTVCKQFDGSVFILYNGRKIPCEMVKRSERQIEPETSAKGLNKYLDRIIYENTVLRVKQEVNA